MFSHPIYFANSLPKQPKSSIQQIQKTKSGRLIEVPKQLLPLRSEIPSLFSRQLETSPSSSSSSSSSFSCFEEGTSKFRPNFVERDSRRILKMAAAVRSNRSSARYSADMLSAPQQPSITTFGASSSTPIMNGFKPSHPSSNRAPSSGFSSSTSSENMMSRLSIGSEEEKKIADELLDPSIEVDLDPFMTQHQQFQQRQMCSSQTMLNHRTTPIRNPIPNTATRSKLYQTTRQTSNPIVNETSISTNNNSQLTYANIKQQPDFVDFSWMPSTTTTIPSQTSSSGVGSASSSSSSAKPVKEQQSKGGGGCNYCWQSYVKLCNRVANVDPVFPVDGPWNWHQLFDAQGRVVCPRLWFAQIDRAGTEMLEQMAKHNAGYMF